MDASALNVMAVTGKRLGFVLNNSLGAMAAPLVSKARKKKKEVVSVTMLMQTCPQVVTYFSTLCGSLYTRN